ncbi:hypothetical protein PV10_03745 [Exophiala mesophila]|uniref:Ecp2 effector protein domain-containing protein n=1 Tax=Exophiala mesophila TaxID=212818 RepID=A0A0D2A079_EXOME|nr:uncharacterized protein PV10_03745 [Exophiala mesophila]KIV92448.1 hypothetical protein PV10_03745 [Exophiala mesophila]
MISLKFLVLFFVAITLSPARAQADSPDVEVEHVHEHEARELQNPKDYENGVYRFDEPILTGFECGWQAVRRLKRGQKGGDKHCEEFYSHVTKKGLMYDVSVICDSGYAPWGEQPNKLGLQLNTTLVNARNTKEQRIKNSRVRVVYPEGGFQFFDVDMIAQGIGRGDAQIGWKGFRCRKVNFDAA